ncbi:MAG: DUF4376 domain-containing protein [Proteobacteria bacterium]|nr:DUF4376 domain-containing protein [Pseudomonadota bacterium]MBU1648249.1 DUF4376 domain-containing protein [Pseudomonadota bacterium]MBU1986143.1 DUF4376 domain-containing protein [Pseudomonadota bacterium]
MRQIFRIDQSGLYLEDVILAPGVATPADCVEIQPQGFNQPKWNGTTWVEGVEPEEIILQFQLKKKAEIEAARDAACYADVTALGHTWQADIRSQDLLNKTISLCALGLPLPPTWRTLDNIDVPITGMADLLAIAGAMAYQTQFAYSTSWALKAQGLAATRVQQIETIVWP